MTKTGRVRAVALLAAVGLLPLGCSDSSKQPSAGPPQDVTTTSRPRPASRCPRLTADPADADRLADAVAGMLACHDTRSDPAGRHPPRGTMARPGDRPGARSTDPHRRDLDRLGAPPGLDSHTSRENRPTDPARLHRPANRPGQTDDEHTDRRLGHTRRTSPDHAVDPDPGQTRRRLASDDDPGNVIAQPGQTTTGQQLPGTIHGPDAPPFPRRGNGASYMFVYTNMLVSAILAERSRAGRYAGEGVVRCGAPRRRVAWAGCAQSRDGESGRSPTHVQPAVDAIGVRAAAFPGPG